VIFFTKVDQTDVQEVLSTRNYSCCMHL